LAGVGPWARFETAMPLARAFAAPRLALTWLVESAIAERTRWPLWLPVALGTGVGLYFSLPIEPPAGIAFASAGVALIAAAIASAGNNAMLRVLFALIAMIATGFTIAKMREESVAAPVLMERVGPASLIGRVEYAQAHGKGIRVLLSHLSSRRFEDGTTPDQVRISFRTGADKLNPGDVIRATAVLMPPPGPAAPNAYDFGRAAFFQRIGAVGYAYGRPDLVSHASPSLFESTVGQLIARLRFRMTERIHNILPGSTGAIASALITGDRGGISDSDETSLRDAGLAHVLAIAGLHMALVGIGLFWLARAALAAVPAVALRYPIKKWAATMALLGAAFYLIISGAGAPSIRAFTMLAMMLLAILFDRPALSMRSVGLAAAIILVNRPESLVEPGFQMSFSAVVGLIAVAEWEQARAARRARSERSSFSGLRRYMRGIATTSLVGSIATMPYAVFHFDRATHYAVVGNLLAMPIMGFVAMPAAAISVALMPFGLDAWPLRMLGIGISAMVSVGHWVSTLPGAVSVVAAWPISALICMSLGGLWCAIWKRNWRWLGLAPVTFGAAVAFDASAPDVLVARDAHTVAIRHSDGHLYFLGRPRDGYSANEWLKRDGDERTSDDAIGSSVQSVRCDGLGCRARVGTKVLVASVWREEALEEDCIYSDIVVAAVTIETPCTHPRLVLDATRINDAGGLAVWLAPFKIETVQGERGDRPWSRQPLTWDNDD
jgi:competence protein ComEC